MLIGVCDEVVEDIVDVVGVADEIIEGVAEEMIGIEVVEGTTVLVMVAMGTVVETDCVEGVETEMVTKEEEKVDETKGVNDLESVVEPTENTISRNPQSSPFLLTRNQRYRRN